MNLVGKIFIVLIFVMSLVWMWSSVTVYATHTNWREFVENDEDGLKVQVQRAKERNQELDDQRVKLETALNAEKAGKRQALTKLQSRNDELERQRTEQEKMLADRVTQVGKANAELKAAHEQETVLRNEVIALREEIKQARKDRDDNFDLVVKRTDDLHQAANQYRALKARMVTLTEDWNKAKEVLDIHDLKPVPAIYTGIAPAVDGVVLKVGADGKTLELSIGADDGLMKGHRLEIYREGGGWLGRVEVMQTSPDKAVCKVLPEFLQRPIQRDDRVTTKLKVD
jgi:hypothetical protein